MSLHQRTVLCIQNRKNNVDLPEWVMCICMVVFVLIVFGVGVMVGFYLF